MHFNQERNFYNINQVGIKNYIKNLLQSEDKEIQQSASKINILLSQHPHIDRSVIHNIYIPYTAPVPFKINIELLKIALSKEKDIPYQYVKDIVFITRNNKSITLFIFESYKQYITSAIEKWLINRITHDSQDKINHINFIVGDDILLKTLLNNEKEIQEASKKAIERLTTIHSSDENTVFENVLEGLKLSLAQEMKILYQNIKDLKLETKDEISITLSIPKEHKEYLTDSIKQWLTQRWKTYFKFSSNKNMDVVFTER